MKNILLISTLVLFLFGCSDDDGIAARPAPEFNGIYTAYAYTLEGDCMDPGEIVFTVWQNIVYDDPQDPTYEITGTINSSRIVGEVDGLFLPDALFFEGVITRADITGDWILFDGTCNGYFLGTKTSGLTL